MVKDIYLYTTLENWLREEPDATLKGYVQKHSDYLLEIKDEKGFIQLVNLSKLFAVVY